MATNGNSTRVGVQTGETIDRSRPLTFTFNGKSYSGYEGDTIASALAANGVQLFSRSFKYHAPRGIMTAGWLDPNLMVQLGDEPNVRAGHRLVRDGDRVFSQDVWPSLKYDAKAVNQVIGRFLAPGFYYKTFIKPQRLWPAYEKVLKQFVHAGKVDTNTPRVVKDKTYANPDVLVVGGGPAGMYAALAAADAGARVMIVDEDTELGGHWLYSGEKYAAKRKELAEKVRNHPNIECHENSVVTARYDGNWFGVVVRYPDGSERLIKTRAQMLVVAAGLIERPYVFKGNDLPGVMLMTGARRLLNRYGVKPGNRAVVFTANQHGDDGIEELRAAGVHIAAVVDGRNGEYIRAAEGKGKVERVVLGDNRVVDADLLVTSVGWTAPTSLLNMAGDKPVYDAKSARFFPTENMDDNVVATGGIVGDGTDEQQREHAEATGRQAAAKAAQILAKWQAASPLESIRKQAESNGSGTIPEVAPLPRDPHPELFRSTTHGFIDFSEDVTSDDIFTAVGEGYNLTELTKRYTTTTMGPLQGKLEVINSVAVIAEATGRTMNETGTTVWRPPYAPTTLGALAGRNMDPVRYSPMQSWHEANGAQPLIAGAWIRPEHYGNPAGEVNNVRNNVGIIDVTPLGKLDLKGKNVPDLLEYLYTNRWRKLPVGGVRYGVMCGEDGVVFDDGVTGRLGEDHYLMTTTSGGAGAVWEVVEEVLQVEHPEWDVTCTPVTTSMASINVAGPKCRELLERISDVDLNPDAFPYMNVRRGKVAGVDNVVLWRIGFTGELSYELHVPAEYGLHVWETLLEVGQDLGIAPFGIEAQRILRLEKGHLIVGQDTDGLTQGFSAGLDWAIKLDKEDFRGLPELRWQKEDGPVSQLVAVQPINGDEIPVEAAQIINNNTEILGRITSSRMSPSLGRSICLAQVRTDMATPGTQLRILQPDGSIILGKVCEELSHFDPEGVRGRG